MKEHGIDLLITGLLMFAVGFVAGIIFAAIQSSG